MNGRHHVSDAFTHVVVAFASATVLTGLPLEWVEAQIPAEPRSPAETQILAEAQILADAEILAEAQTKASHHRRLTQKSMGPLVIEAGFASEPVSGQTVQIRLGLSSSIALSDVHVTLDADDTLVLLIPARQVVLGPIEAAAKETLTVEILLLEPGRHYLRVFVTATSARGAVTRPLVIPVVATGPATAASRDSAESSLASPALDAKGQRVRSLHPARPDSANTSDGRPLSSMPARETVRP